MTASRPATCFLLLAGGFPFTHGAKHKNSDDRGANGRDDRAKKPADRLWCGACSCALKTNKSRTDETTQQPAKKDRNKRDSSCQH